ncbi:MAG: hypothetical protein WA118_13490 [Carboxydocellales bacterium]
MQIQKKEYNKNLFTEDKELLFIFKIADSPKICLIYRELTKAYLEGTITEEQVQIAILKQVDETFILNSDNEFIVNVYQALKHLTDEYKTSHAELGYLYNWMINERTFTQEDRNEYIMQHYSKSKK